MIRINCFNLCFIAECIGNSFRKKLLAFLCLLVLSSVFQGNKATAQTTEGYDWNNVAIGGGGFVSAIIPSKTEQNLVYARTDVGGAYRWNVSTSTWIPLLDWCSEDELGYQGVESLAIDPQSPNKVYMLVGTTYFSGGRTAILRSDDYGNTFTIIDVTSQFKTFGNGMGRQAGEKLVVDPNNSNILYCGTRWNGLFKSTDAGTTWSRLNSLDVTTTPNENGISFVVLDGSSVSGGATQRIIVGVSRSGSTNLYRSDDGGQSFSAVSGATTTYMPHRATLASDGDLYITYGNGAGPHGSYTQPEPMNEGQIWKYNVSSGAWADITPSGYNMAFGGICVDPNNPERLVASTINAYWTQYKNTNNGKDVHGDRIFLSTNGGTSWVDVVDRGFTLDTDGITWVYGHSIHWAGSIEFDPFNTERVWITSGNGLFVNDSISSSSTWRFSVKGIEETVSLGLVSIPNGPVISVIGDYDGFRHTDVTQYAPIHNPQMGTTTGLSVAAQNTSKIVRVGNSMYYSTDMGLTWTQSNMNGSQGKVALSADGNTVLHSPRDSSVTYLSTNNGSSWSRVDGLNFNEARPVGDPVNSNKFYAYNPGNGAVMVSTNGGSSFSQASSVATGGSNFIRVAPDREGDLWVALKGGGLARSTNSGQSFSIISGISNCGAVGFGIADSGANYPTIYIWGTINNVTGLYRSTDQGVSWVRVNDDAHEYGGPGNGKFVEGDMNVFGRVYMSTAGRGIVYGTPACTPSTITSYIQVNGGNWQQTANASLATGDTIMFGPQPVTGGSWSWSGPNSFTATTRDVYIANIQENQAGNYVATYTNDGGCQSTQTFVVTVTAPCTPTAITPYVQIDGGTWQQTDNASVVSGGSVMFGPQPNTGGSWSWSGPNNFSATTREVYISNIQTSQAGNYVATYTNDGGCQSTQVLGITVDAATGTILREYWTGISGTIVSDLTSNANYPNSPSGSEQLTSLEGPTNWDDNYGTRIRGYIHPTTTGDYTFWVAGDDNTELYLSTDDNPANATRIAYLDSWTNSREWGKYTTQQSTSVSLTAGQKYYVEVLHKEGSGGDNVAVAWQGPDITQQVITGSYLSPYVLLKNATVELGISPDEEDILDNMELYPNPASDGKFNISFHGIKGTVTISIYNIQGKLVYKQSETGKGQVVVNSQLVKGLYLVKVQSDTSTITRRLVVK